jgi:hypothetical protein
MPLEFRIYPTYHRALTSLARLIGSEPPELTVPLISDIMRYFLSEAIEDRVKFLAGGAAGQEETLRDEVSREYSERVEEAIRQELKAHSQRWAHFIEMEKRLADIKLSTPFNDDIFATRESLIELIREPMVFFPGRFGSYEALVLAGVFLRAIQQVTLDIVRIDYPATAPGTEVPPDAQKVVRKILGRIDKLQQLFQTPVELKSLTKAETELRVLVARAKGVACLPLRPIPTSPLSSDETSHYVGRPDEEASRLARQIRHADGTILVTGYRGVGKSSFVNRVIFHARAAQENVPSDGWLIVPITVNLAKVAGVQNILRITLRSVREALLDADSRTAKAIPGHLKSIPLPLSREDEIEPLEEAYIRATYKVTMSRSTGSERRAEFGSSISIDPGKWLGGKIVGMELGKFLEAGIKNTKTAKINRELNLLDFDENAAEDSLGRLIRSLATPRPIVPGGPDVRIKLVFVFDELDKMDVDTGLKPMIEGLKNLFLQQYSVFILVTSKKFYYDLLKDRAIEDAMLNSYFSAIVHVPLLSYEQARKMVNDWVDWKGAKQLETPAPAESKLIDQLTRVLVYRSFGNPRDIIRELRLMQDWADTADQPYLTDRLSKSPNLQIFAAIQDCIEKTALPQQSTSPVGGDPDGSVTLVAERLVGNDARLEQVRRGLYILTEELINRQTLPLESPSLNGEPVEKKQSSPLEKIQQDNFSLLSVEDVRQLTKRLGGYLSLMHDSPDLFPTPDWGPRAPLFELEGSELRTTNYFYTLTGRQAAVMAAEPAAPSAQTKTPEVLAHEAENLAAQASWAPKLAAINIIKQLGSDKLTPPLKKFLWEVAGTDPDQSHRRAAAELLPTKIESEDDIKTITGLLAKETDERVLSIFIGMLSGASGDEARKSATDAIIGLLQFDDSSRPVQRRLTDSTAVVALTVLQTVASHDVTSELLEWLIIAGETDLVQTTGISALKKISEQFGIDVAEKIVSNDSILEFFTTGLPRWRRTFNLVSPPAAGRADNVPKTYLRELLRSNALAYVPKLLRADPAIDVNDLLIYIWTLNFGPFTRDASLCVFNQIVDQTALSPVQDRLRDSLRSTPEFQTRILPSLRKQLPELIKEKRFTEDQGKSIEATLNTLEALPEPAPAKPKASAQSLYESVIAHLPKTPPGSPYVSEPEFDPTRTVAFVVVAILLFLPGFFFYKADLPAGVSFGTMLTSRLLLLVLDGLIMYPFVNAIASARTIVRKENSSQVPNALYGVLVPLVYAVYYTHIKYIGPLHFGAQSLQFVINWPAIMALFLGFRLYKP